MKKDHPAVNVTKSFLPPLTEYEEYLKQIWDNTQLTNQGPLLKEFEAKAKEYLNIANFHFVTNGTLALQIALRVLDVSDGEIITTPFSYVATTSSILWESCTPVFVDIEPQTFCIDPSKIEAAITPKTKAIMPVHVFGYPCDVEKIEEIARQHNLKVIYDGAHAFGTMYKGKSLLSYGDISICSFHATKPFHTIEGGCIIAKDDEINSKIELIKRFGHHGDEHFMLGINAKASEFQAAMGLCNLKYIEEIIEGRRNVAELYDSLLGEKVNRPEANADTKYNYAYYPVVFETNQELLRVTEELTALNIFPRRYFYPSLNTLPYISSAAPCPVSEDISDRILCLPFYADLEEAIVKKIARVITG